MTLSTDNIIAAIERVVSANFPNEPIYSNPVQQGTKNPAWYIQFMPSITTEREPNARINKEYKIDLIREQEYNLPNAYDIARAAAEKLDLALADYIDYEDEDGNTGKLCIMQPTEWSVRMAELHYKFTIRVRASISRPASDKMQNLQNNIQEG